MVSFSVDFWYHIHVARDLLWTFLTFGDKAEPTNHEEESRLAAFYRVERNLRQALKPMYEVLFERLNTHPGGLKFLSIIRADIVSILE